MKPISASHLAWALFLIALPGCSSSGDSSSQGGPSPLDRCGLWGHACCEGNQCGPGLLCQGDWCVQGRPNEFGRHCDRDTDCEVGICADWRCTIGCEDSSQCPVHWGCKRIDNSFEPKACQCTAVLERCDNTDSDCDGVVDNQATVDRNCAHEMGDGYICRQGKCICPGTCGGKCVNLLGDNKNCGACGKSCGPKETCLEGQCESVFARMVRIPGGTFSMGAEDLERSSPVHSVTVSSFWLDETEVTMQAYLACVDDGACSPQKDVHGCNTQLEPHKPANCVDRDQAKAFCTWAGKKLPTEAQWEYAARHGADNWLYPWGNEEPQNALLCWNGGDVTCEVGSHGAYGFGLRDMAGNLSEWVADDLVPYSSAPQTDPFIQSSDYFYGFVVRGGNYSDSSSQDVRASYRHDGWIGYYDLGIRCAK